MNNEQIDETSYYRLPCGLQVEDYLWLKRVPFWLGSAIKYRFRAGHKDGESADKDTRKSEHYLNYAGAHDACYRSSEQWEAILGLLVSEMCEWDGDSSKILPFEAAW